MGEIYKGGRAFKRFIALAIISSLTVLVIYLINLVSIQLPAEQSKRNHWEHQAKASPKNFQLICPPSKNGKPIPAEKCELSGYYKYDRQQQLLDHYAQVSIKVAAWVTAVITGLGLVLIGITLWQAFKAAGLASEMLVEAKEATGVAREGLAEARSATLAANESVKVTRDMGEAQSRAYISLENPILNIPEGGWSENKDGDIRFDASIAIRNTGNTPAYNIDYKFKIIIRDQDSGVIARTEYGVVSKLSILGHTAITQNLDSMMVLKWNTGGRTTIETIGTRCTVTIRFEYSDVFKNRYFVESDYFGIIDSAQLDASSNTMKLALNHYSSNDKYGKIERNL